MEKIFDVIRAKNGRGDSNLLVITEEAIPDLSIGTVLIVPYANGFSDPKKVLLETDEAGIPKTSNNQFAIVNEYIYD